MADRYRHEPGHPPDDQLRQLLINQQRLSRARRRSRKRGVLWRYLAWRRTRRVARFMANARRRRKG